MTTFRTGTVVSLLTERAGLQRMLVRLEGSDQRAYNLTELTGPVGVGDTVVCNTTAVARGLGTGGWHVVHWNLSRSALDAPSGGHIMKLRYTSLQADTGAAEEHRPDLPTSISGVPVVVCSLHSQMGVVAAAFARAAPGRRLVYVMTDGAALPLVLSDLVHSLRSAGLLAGTVTTGHAFGGEREAVNVVSALTVAVHELGADAVVVSMGPGVVGTGSDLGTTALEVGPILGATAWLGGVPIAALRVSDVDPRPRHQGVSHHSITALSLVGTTVDVAVPEQDVAMPSLHKVRTLGHTVVPVAIADVAQTLQESGQSITTMGRGPDDDPVFFRFAAAAGVLAARRLAPL